MRTVCFFCWMVGATIGLSLFATQKVFSQTATSRLSTTIEPNFFAPYIPDRVSYFAILSGPSTKGGSRFDEFGESDPNSISTWAQISFQWQLDARTRFVVNPRFALDHDWTSPESESKVEFDEPVFGITRRWFQGTRWSLSGGLNTIVPWLRRQDLRDDGLIFNPGGFQMLSYRATSKLSFGSQLWARAFFYDGSNESDADRGAIFFAPQVDYQFNDRFGLSFFYQVNGDVENNYALTIGQDETLNLSGTMNLLKGLALQPMISLYRNTDFSLDKANLNLWLSGSLF